MNSPTLVNAIFISASFALALGHGILVKKLPETLGHFRRFFWPAKPQHIAADAATMQNGQIDILVQKAFFSYQDKFYRQMMSIMSPSMCAGMLFCSMNELMGLPRWMSPAQDMLLTFASSTVMFMWYFPRAFHANTQDLVFALWMVLLTLFVAPPFCDQPIPRASDAFLLMSRIYVGCSASNELIVLCFNVAYTISATWSDVILSDEPHPSNSAAGNLTTLVVTLAFITVWKRAIKRETRDMLLMRQKEMDLSAAHSLIHGMCDAVFELDAELRLTKDESRFASLLLYDTSHRFALQKLDDFMFSEKDALSFAQNMSSPTGDAPFTTDSFSVKLRDRDGNAVALEVFHVSSRSISGDVVHQVGLREHSDVFDTSSAELPVGVGNMILSDENDEDGQAMQVWFDPHAFQIISCSPSFASFCGSSSFRCDMMGWIPAANMLGFQRKYSRLLSKFSGGQALNQDEDFGVLSLEVPICMSSFDTLLVIEAECLICMSRRDCSAEIRACLQLIEPAITARQTCLSRGSRKAVMRRNRCQTGSLGFRRLRVDGKAVSSKNRSQQEGTPSATSRSGSIHELHSSSALGALTL